MKMKKCKGYIPRNEGLKYENTGCRGCENCDVENKGESIYHPGGEYVYVCNVGQDIELIPFRVEEEDET
jgi:hypothetical protein